MLKMPRQIGYAVTIVPLCVGGQMAHIPPDPDQVSSSGSHRNLSSPSNCFGVLGCFYVLESTNHINTVMAGGLNQVLVFTFC